MTGTQLPEVGTRVFLSLDIGGLPNVRLPAVTVRLDREGNGSSAAVRFDVPSTCIGGLDRLLAQHIGTEPNPVSVLVVDSDERSRARVAHAVQSSGARVLAVESVEAAQSAVGQLAPSVVLARADGDGLIALSMLGRALPDAFRVAFGRKSAVETALARGVAQAAADDPCSAKCLSELLRKSRARSPS